MSPRPSPVRPWSTRAPTLVGYSALVLLVGALGSWSIGARVAGAVVAFGTVKVDSELQVVQHAEGGVVGAILAAEGDSVRAGDVLIRFDDTFLRSELAIVERQLHELFARRARLSAERDGREAIDFALGRTAYDLDPAWMAAQFEGQRSLFRARAERLSQEIATLRERQAQIRQKIRGIEAQERAAAEEHAIVAAELSDKETLNAKGLVPIAAVRLLRRQAAELAGDIASYRASIAEERGLIAEIETQALGLRSARLEQVIAELRNLGYVEIELEERRLSLLEKLSRLEVRAPVDGTVFGARVFAVKAVVLPAEPILHIAPSRQPMQVSARVDPIHIDQVHEGQTAMLRFTSYNRRVTPQLPGEVVRVSADTLVNDATGARYYEVVIAPDPEALAGAPGIEMKLGLPVEAQIRTEERRPFDYLVQPMTDYFNRAFRE